MRYLIIGAAGHAQEVAWSLREQCRAAGVEMALQFFDDNLPRGPLASGLGEVVGDIDHVREHLDGDEVRLVMGVGLPRTKRSLALRLAPLGVRWATVIHPLATLGPNVELGEGSYVGVGAVLTVSVHAGRFVTINTHAQAAHDDVLGDFVTLHPNVHVAGCVSIGEGCELGTGTVVIPGITIDAWAVVGAGSAVVEPLAGARTYVGVPARPLPARPSRRPEPRQVEGAC